MHSNRGMNQKRKWKRKWCQTYTFDKKRKWCQTYIFDKGSSFTIFVISFPSFLSFFCFIRILRLAWITPDSITPNRFPISLSFLPLYRWHRYNLTCRASFSSHASFVKCVGLTPLFLRCLVPFSSIVESINIPFCTGIVGIVPTWLRVTAVLFC